MWRELDLEKVEQDLRGVLSRGITSLAVLLLHSYTSVVLCVLILLRLIGSKPLVCSCRRGHYVLKWWNYRRTQLVFRLRPTFTPRLCFSFRWSDHEKAVGALARRLGFTQVSLSSEVMPMVRAVPRGYTVCADAYLTPKIRQYLKGFTSGFKGGLKVR